MTYKEFRKWYDQRKADNILKEETSQRCQEIIEIFDKLPKWKRNYIWKRKFRILVVGCIVFPTDLELAIESSFKEEEKYNRDPRSIHANDISLKEEETNND